MQKRIDATGAMVAEDGRGQGDNSPGAGDVTWACPTCRGVVSDAAGALRCVPCGRDYPVVAGIPDFRVQPVDWVDCAEDRRAAAALAERAAGQPIEATLREVFAARGMDPARVEVRVRQVLEAPGRLRRDVRAWLDRATGGRAPFLDLGCGPGMLLAAAAAEARPGVGIDASMTWLVVARALTASLGARPPLAAALGEALPLPDGSVGGAVSLDVLEHVADVGQYLAQLDRVVARGGHLALTTPNRYSLTAEPHVKVWGVGLLPRALQRPYAEWRSHLPYQSTVLRSARELRALLAAHTRFAARLELGGVAPEELATFPPHRALAARIYNAAITSPVAALLVPIAPYFRVVGGKG